MFALRKHASSHAERLRKMPFYAQNAKVSLEIKQGGGHWHSNAFLVPLARWTSRRVLTAQKLIPLHYK